MHRERNRCDQRHDHDVPVRQLRDVHDRRDRERESTRLVSNTASATPPSGGVCAPANTPGPCTATATVSPQAQVGIAKTVDTDTVTPGGTLRFTVTVSNTGSVSADGTTVSDPVAAGITSQTWSCTPTGGATCTASGTGAIADTLATFPPGSYVVYTIMATASATPPANIVNTASATPPDGVCTPTNTPAPCSASASVLPGPQIAIAKSADTRPRRRTARSRTPSPSATADRWKPTARA